MMSTDMPPGRSVKDFVIASSPNRGSLRVAYDALKPDHTLPDSLSDRKQESILAPYQMTWQNFAAFLYSGAKILNQD